MAEDEQQIVISAWVIFREGETGVLSIQRVFHNSEYTKATKELLELSQSIEARYFLMRVQMAR